MSGISRLVIGAFQGPHSAAKLVPGVGTIEQVEMTGLEINGIRVYKLAMRVTDKDSNEFHGTLKAPIPPHQTQGLIPGAMLPVGFKPEKPEKLYPLPSERVGEVNDLLQQDRIKKGLSDQESVETVKRGVSVTGVVVESTPTGEVRDGHTALDITVRFARADQPSEFIDRTKTVYLQPQQVANVAVGRQVQVFYRPEDDAYIAMGIAANG
ncbi:hypothetical protein [Devriesea agamarum]|uniref:hypothetical protein n=1 Tax=Devriesea agamarum TaxID=472569 RepID=UPI00071D374E|nr:hypothetical protein [Devriesea agamarum]